ncbi:MAG: DUF805 domain-containing protein [Terricaulis sp.]
MAARDAFAAFARLITWRARINRMQFGVGYVALAFVGAIVMQLAMFALAAMLGGIELMFEHTEWIMPLFLPVVLVLFGLIAARAHDIGWPGWPIVALYLLPWPAWFVIMDGVGMFGGFAADALAGVPLEFLEASIFIPAVLTVVALIVLASVPGKRIDNRYGPAVAPGLWNDLPPTRA